MSRYATNFKSSEPPAAERTSAPAPQPEVAERPVFASTGTTRPRLLRVAGRVAAGLTVLWLAALALGVGGLGGLPSIDLPVVGKPGGGSHEARSPDPAPRPIAAAESNSARVAAQRSAHARDAARARRLAQPGAKSPSGGTAPAATSAATTAEPGSSSTASPPYSSSAVRRGTSSTAPGTRRSTTTTDSTASPRGNAKGRNTDPGARRQSAP